MIHGIENKSEWNIDYTYLQPKLKLKIFFLFLSVTKNMIHMTNNKNSEFDFYVQSKFDRRHYNQKQKSTFMCDVRRYTSNQKSFMHS